MTVEPTEVNTIRLTGPVTLYEVSAVGETLRMALAEGKQLRIDLSDSGPWDLAGLQLLISCAQSDEIVIWRSAWLASQRTVPRSPSDPDCPNGSSKSGSKGEFRDHHSSGFIFMSKTVLHADDNATVRRWVAEQLSDMDLKVISVADGEAALQVLRESPCDLLLTDLEMPNLRRVIAGGRRPRLADAPLFAGAGPVLPSARRVSTGAPAGCDRVAGQADRTGTSATVGRAGLATMNLTLRESN